MIEYKVKLGIYSKKHSAERIADILGIMYDQCWVMGMPRSARSEVMKFEQHAWFIVSAPSFNQTPLDKQINLLFSRIESSLSKLSEFVQDCDICFNCSIEGDENPELYFTKETIMKMSHIHASLDIDMYIA